MRTHVVTSTHIGRIGRSRVLQQFCVVLVLQDNTVLVADFVTDARLPVEILQSAISFLAFLLEVQVYLCELQVRKVFFLVYGT